MGWRKKYIRWIVYIGIFILVWYFLKIVIIDNKEIVLNVLVLDTKADAEKIKKELAFYIKPNKKERIEITKIDPTIPENDPVILTWIRSRTFDLLLAEEKQMERFANAGYFFPLDDLLGDAIKELDTIYRCDLLEHDDEGNVQVVEKEKPFGIYMRTNSQLYQIQDPIVSVVINAPNKKNVVKVLENWVINDKRGRK